MVTLLREPNVGNRRDRSLANVVTGGRKADHAWHPTRGHRHKRFQGNTPRCPLVRATLAE